MAFYVYTATQTKEALYKLTSDTEAEAVQEFHDMWMGDLDPSTFYKALIFNGAGDILEALHKLRAVADAAKEDQGKASEIAKLKQRLAELENPPQAYPLLQFDDTPPTPMGASPVDHHGQGTITIAPADPEILP